MQSVIQRVLIVAAGVEYTWNPSSIDIGSDTNTAMGRENWQNVGDGDMAA